MIWLTGKKLLFSWAWASPCPKSCLRRLYPQLRKIAMSDAWLFLGLPTLSYCTMLQRCLMATRHLLLGWIALIKHVGWKVWDNTLRKGSADLGKHRHCGHCRLFVTGCSTQECRYRPWTNFVFSGRNGNWTQRTSHMCHLQCGSLSNFSHQLANASSTGQGFPSSTCFCLTSVMCLGCHSTPYPVAMFLL